MRHLVFTTYSTFSENDKNLKITLGSTHWVKLELIVNDVFGLTEQLEIKLLKISLNILNKLSVN